MNVGEILRGTISFNVGGSAYFSVDDNQKEIYIGKENTNRSLHLDTVDVKLIKSKSGGVEGKVVDVVKRFRETFVGTISKSKKFAFLKPDNRKITVDFYIPLDKLDGAEDNQKVVVKFVEWGKNEKCPTGEVVEVIGNAGENEVEINSIMQEYELPMDFPQHVIDEAEAISDIIPDKEIAKRADFRNVLTFTIDPDDAKDFDDAISFIDMGNNIYTIGIHIADVSHYVRPQTSLDDEAYDRGTSVYLVDRVVPMLPEHLSNNVCSLKPNVDRLCFSVIVTMDKNGKVLDTWMGKSVINSNYRLTYAEAQDYIDSKRTGEVGEPLKILDHIAKKMRSERMKNDGMDLKTVEVKFKLDDNKKPLEIIVKNHGDSNELIEEFMLLANKRVARFVNKKNLPLVNRIHEEPFEDKIESLRIFLAQFGFKLKTKSPDEIKKSLKLLTEELKGKPLENMVNQLIVRTMSKAAYSTDNIGHYGLGFKDYCHFTSPIRRYPDLMVHRLLYLYLNEKYNVKASKLEPKCEHLSNMERKAQKAERDSIKFKQAEFMMDKVGKVYTGVVVGVIEIGLFVELTDFKCEGLVRINNIDSSDRYILDVRNYCIEGLKSKKKIKLGDEVMVKVKAVHLDRKMFELTLF